MSSHLLLAVNTQTSENTFLETPSLYEQFLSVGCIPISLTILRSKVCGMMGVGKGGGHDYFLLYLALS